MGDQLKMEVWIHSHAITGKPDSVAVFAIDGKMNMAWFTEAMEDGNGPDLAQQFYEHLGKLDDYAWFIVSQETETAMDSPEHYVDVIGLIDNPK